MSGLDGAGDAAVQIALRSGRERVIFQATAKTSGRLGIVAEQERYTGAGLCRAVERRAAQPGENRCASSPHAPKSPALSVPHEHASYLSPHTHVRPTLPLSPHAPCAARMASSTVTCCSSDRRVPVAGCTIKLAGCPQLACTELLTHGQLVRSPAARPVCVPQAPCRAGIVHALWLVGDRGAHAWPTRCIVAVFPPGYRPWTLMCTLWSAVDVVRLC